METTAQLLVIEKLLPGDAEVTARLLTVAFAENPNSRAVFNEPGGPESIAAGTLIMRTMKLNRKYSNVYVAKVNGEIVGAINFVQSPRCQPSFWEKLKSAPLMLKVLGKKFSTAGKIFGTWGKHDPKELHIHIGPLGVLPEYKGQGIGSALLRHVLGLADEQNVPCYLETDAARNIPLYERHGFQVTKEIPVLDYPTWLMWREVGARRPKS